MKVELQNSSVVVIPTLKRPEFLALTLERLSQTPEAEHLDIRIFLDTATDQQLDDVEYCRDTYLPTAEIFRAGEHISVLSGCWNILNALKSGYEMGAEFIYLVEEDVAVRPNFFQWHKEQHDSNDYFVTCARRCGHMPPDFYSNPGTCYRRDKFAQVIPHICEEYFSEPRTYLKKHFPTMDGMDGPLDDGLIRKVIRSTGGKVLCADPSVAVHQGFHYYDRLPEFKLKVGSIQDRVEQLKALLPTIDPKGRYSQDFEPY
ncbi:MAG: hypothetical protein OK457_07845 [Thaumarchaeota archaeon]|nr:hypothetical protein [Nitrososphaerota archaeon]